jgi:glycosyltransferase involved in cell wall biosynthesis
MLFFLYVGSLEPRKDLGCLLEAWDRAAFTDWKLVIVGDRAGIFEGISLKNGFATGGSKFLSPEVLCT